MAQHTAVVEPAPPQTVPDGPPASRRLEIPASSQPARIYWQYLVPLVLVHLLALLALVPWFFSWAGVIAAVVGHVVFGMFGITIGYHRLLTHQGFTCPKWFEHLLALLGVCTLQDSPARWVAIHRVHHKESDHQPDPHSPLAGFFWGHAGWLLVQNRDHRDVMCYERYVRDLLRDPFYLRLERNLLWMYVYLAHAALFAALGAAIGWFTAGTLAETVRMAASLLVWGAFVRTVVMLHTTWAVNSFGHVWGYRNYETGDNSRNNALVSLVAYGEGWHNNHHADQRAAAHGHRWWELDPSWWTIRGLEAIGLAKNVVRPRAWVNSTAATAARPTGSGSTRPPASRT